MDGNGIEFEQRAKAQNASYDEPRSISQAINSELFKVLADNWIQEAGIKPLLHATAVDVIRITYTVLSSVGISAGAIWMANLYGFLNREKWAWLWRAVAAAILLGLMTLTIAYPMGLTHTWNGINYAGR